ncbi:helix-turn-helix transcriptional regulator [Nonomuraea sp. NPDC050404]|uniref:helix-turn-helix domain-containing protein n=1 Tax=Nonomuraea sp. NPDC050404 TaxID=3155783 RepID=UPI0033F3EE43
MNYDGETFGQMLRRLRGSQSLSVIGRLANVSKSHVHDLQNGRRAPSRSVAMALDEVLSANGELVAAYEAHVGIRPSTGETACLRTLEERVLLRAEEEDTERRQLLRLAAGAGFGGVFGYNETVRQMLDLSAYAHRSIEDWDIARTDHLHTLRSRPPSQVVSDLAIDLHDLARQMAQCPATDLQELYRTAATLACIQANALTRLARHGEAIRWWRTSRRLADASQDATLQLTVRAEEAGHGLYGQRSPDTVLHLIAQARRISARPWPRMMTAEAEALAMLGRHREAMETLRSLVDHVERGLKGDELGFWKEDAIPFAQSWVHGCAGDEDGAAEAREQVQRLAPEHSYQVLTNVLFHQDVCTVARGGVDEGIRHTAEVLDGLPAAYRTNHVLETARIVLRTVPQGQRDRRSVRELESMVPSHA